MTIDWNWIFTFLDKYGATVLPPFIMSLCILWLIIIFTDWLNRITWIDKNIPPTITAAFLGIIIGGGIHFLVGNPLLPFLGLIASAVYSIGQEVEKRYGIDLLKIFLIKAKVIGITRDDSQPTK